MQVVIIGAGIGGLAAAVSLSRVANTSPHLAHSRLLLVISGRWSSHSQTGQNPKTEVMSQSAAILSEPQKRTKPGVETRFGLLSPAEI
jgi:glycine/D-amino acid oxidase-like deaminating enzyme